MTLASIEGFSSLYCISVFWWHSPEMISLNEKWKNLPFLPFYKTSLATVTFYINLTKTLVIQQLNVHVMHVMLSSQMLSVT